MDLRVGPVTVSLRERDDGCCRHARQEGAFEPETVEAWAGLCAGGGLVLDIGAYTGLFAIAAAKLGCRVVAFEPLPENALRVRENAAQNGVKVELRREAVSDRAGHSDLWYSTVRNTSAASLVRKRSRRVRVPTVRLDALSLRDVRVIKIDVERAEPMVLRGAAGLLAVQHPALLVEVLGSVEAEEVTRVLGAAYRVERVLDGRNWLVRSVDA
jgi:FkbM family methyltransferase